MILWVLRYLTGIVLMPGSLPSALVSLLLILLTIYYTGKAVLEIRFPLCLKSFLLFGFILLLYGVCLMLKGEVIGTMVSDWTYNGSAFFREILSSVFPVFVLYYFFCKGYVTNKTVQTWSFILLCTASVFYFYKRNQMLIALQDYVVEREGFTNNTAYSIVAFFPLIFYLSSNKFVQLLTFGFCLFLIFLGVKRGAILIASLMLIFYAYITFKNLDRKQKYRYSLILISFAFFAVIVFINNFSTNEYFLSRLESTRDGDVNGRDIIITQLLDAYVSFNFLELIVGQGAYGTLKIIGQFAHNDWIEILISQGLIGIIFYALFYIRLLFFLRKNRKNSVEWYSLVMSFCILFLRTLFSMSYNEIDIWLSLALAYNIYILLHQNENTCYNSQLSHKA